MPQSASLVVTTPYYPGWKAAVDGQPSPLFRADFAFQGLPLAAGAHHVVLRFDPDVFKLGGAISAAGWLAAAAVFIVGLARR